MTCRSLCFSPFPKRFPDFHSWSQSWPPIARGLVLLLLVAPLRCGRCHVEFAAAAEARNLTGTVVAQCWTVVKRNVSTCSTKSDVEWLSHHLLRKKIIIKCILQLHATQNRRNKMWQNGWYNIEKWWKMIKHIFIISILSRDLKCEPADPQTQQPPLRPLVVVLPLRPVMLVAHLQAQSLQLQGHLNAAQIYSWK